MNTSQFMDIQIMDLSASGSSPPANDFMNLQDDHHDHVTASGNNSNNNNNSTKKDEILPNYDFQPIRALGFEKFSNLDGGGVAAAGGGGGGGSRAWNSVDLKTNANTGLKSYGSMDAVEPAQVSVEKNRNLLDASVVSEIDRTMKKYYDDLLYALEGISARLTQLESRTRNLENCVDDLQVSVGNNHGSTDGKIRQLENILREVHTGVRDIRDNQEKVEAQLLIAKMQTSKADLQSETQKTLHTDSAQQTVSAPQQPIQIPPPLFPSSFNPHLPHNPPPPPLQQHNMSPQVQVPNQYPQNQLPSVPQRDPYFQQSSQSQEAPTQPYLLPPQLPQLPPQATPPPPHQQYHPSPPPPHTQNSQLPPQHPQSLPPFSPANPPQPQPSLPHQPEEMPYPPSQSYPPRQATNSVPSQQYYGPPSNLYEPPPGRPNSGFSSGYGPQTGSNEPYSYGGSASQHGGGSAMKPHQSQGGGSGSYAHQPQGGGSGGYAHQPQGGGSGGYPHQPQGSGSGGYPQLPTARILPQALPTASSASGGSGSAGTGNRVPVDDVVDKVTTMGFPRDVVRATVRKLTENGQSVDLNIVLDKLMNDGDVQPPKGWFRR